MANETGVYKTVGIFLKFTCADGFILAKELQPEGKKRMGCNKNEMILFSSLFIILCWQLHLSSGLAFLKIINQKKY